MRRPGPLFPVWILLLLVVRQTAVAAGPSDLIEPRRELASGTILHLQVDSDAPMKRGAAVLAHTVEPIFVQNQLSIPAGSKVSGKIVEVVPASGDRRKAARMQGDFTPLHEAGVRFDAVTLPDGKKFAIITATAQQGIQMVRIQSLGAAMNQPSLPKRVWNSVNDTKNNMVHTLTAPGKASRLKKYFYHQLPYHPEEVDAGVEYDVELTQPAQVPVAQAELQPAALEKRPDGLKQPAVIHALLQNEISSKSSARGTPVTAIVTEPLFENNQLTVPQGTILEGTVTEAQPAAKMGKTGVLRFAFRQMKFPAGFEQRIHGAPGAIAADRQSKLKMDSEGGVTAQRPSLAAPLIMGFLASTALTEDENSLVHSSVASNGFALIGRLVAISAGSHYVGAAIGLYGTSRSLYARFIGHGSDVTFPRNTRIEIEVDPVTTPALSRGQ